MNFFFSSPGDRPDTQPDESRGKMIRLSTKLVGLGIIAKMTSTHSPMKKMKQAFNTVIGDPPSASSISLKKEITAENTSFSRAGPDI
jgi:hypothetical protein